jgi:hypothetical protein
LADEGEVEAADTSQMTGGDNLLVESQSAPIFALRLALAGTNS